jgi:hypothetical protein
MIPEKEKPLTTDVLADEVDKGLCGASGMPAKLARYSKARRRAIEMEEYCHSHDHVKEGNKLKSCANYLLFHHYYQVDEVRLHAAQFCKKHLLCPLCAIRRGAKMLKAYLVKYGQVINENPSLQPYLVTLTVKNGEDLQETLLHLRSRMKFLAETRRNALKGLVVPNEFSKSYGGFHSIEVTNKGNGWHPHVHMIWLCKDAPDQAHLSHEWHVITGDSYIVDVRPLTDPLEGFIEVCKYAMKFSDLSLEDNFKAYKIMSGMRLIDSHGCMRGVKIPVELLDDALDDQPYVELLYKYMGNAGYSFVRTSESRHGNWNAFKKKKRTNLFSSVHVPDSYYSNS